MARFRRKAASVRLRIDTNKAIPHEQKPQNYRVVCRGRAWYVQEWDEDVYETGRSMRQKWREEKHVLDDFRRTPDPWLDVSPSQASKVLALEVMYIKYPKTGGKTTGDNRL